MAEDDVENTSHLDWIKLADAFQKIGRATYGKVWRDECWRLGYYPLDEQDPYVDRSKIDPADYAENPHQWNGVIFADQKMIRQFEEVSECLEKSLWTGEVHTQFIDSYGKLVDLDRSIWRNRYNHYAVYWSESELLGKESGSDKFVNTWIVEVALSDVEKLTDRITKDRQDTATAISRAKPRGAGRNEEINWEVIDPILIEIYDDDPSCSQAKAYTHLKPLLKEMGWGNTEENRRANTWIPSKSSIAKRIKKLKDSNKINY